jgi:hypothetical protein
MQKPLSDGLLYIFQPADSEFSYAPRSNLVEMTTFVNNEVKDCLPRQRMVSLVDERGQSVLRDIYL